MTSLASFVEFRSAPAEAEYAALPITSADPLFGGRLGAARDHSHSSKNRRLNEFDHEEIFSMDKIKAAAGER